MRTKRARAPDVSSSERVSIRRHETLKMVQMALHAGRPQTRLGLESQQRRASVKNWNARADRRKATLHVQFSGSPLVLSRLPARQRPSATSTSLPSQSSFSISTLVHRLVPRRRDNLACLILPLSRSLRAHRRWHGSCCSWTPQLRLSISASLFNVRVIRRARSSRGSSSAISIALESAALACSRPQSLTREAREPPLE